MSEAVFNIEYDLIFPRKKHRKVLAVNSRHSVQWQNGFYCGRYLVSYLLIKVLLCFVMCFSGYGFADKINELSVICYLLYFVNVCMIYWNTVKIKFYEG